MDSLHLAEHVLVLMAKLDFTEPRAVCKIRRLRKRYVPTCCCSIDFGCAGVNEPHYLLKYLWANRAYTIIPRIEDITGNHLIAPMPMQRSFSNKCPILETSTYSSGVPG